MFDEELVVDEQGLQLYLYYDTCNASHDFIRYRN